MHVLAFSEALLDAKGISLGDGGGNLLAGKAYSTMLDLQPGDAFEIKLSKEQIRLEPAGGGDEEERTALPVCCHCQFAQSAQATQVAQASRRTCGSSRFPQMR